MADELISDLDDAAALADTDLMEVEQGTDPTNTSGKITLLLLRLFALLYRFNAQTGTTYTLALSDAFKIVTLSNASAITVTVPKNATVAIPVGWRADFYWLGVGKPTFAPEDGAVTLEHPVSDTLAMAERYSFCTLVKRDTDTWAVIGRMEATP
jgi:hypothetical protein